MNKFLQKVNKWWFYSHIWISVFFPTYKSVFLLWVKTKKKWDIWNYFTPIDVRWIDVWLTSSVLSFVLLLHLSISFSQVLLVALCYTVKVVNQIDIRSDNWIIDFKCNPSTDESQYNIYYTNIWLRTIPIVMQSQSILSPFCELKLIQGFYIIG